MDVSGTEVGAALSRRCRYQKCCEGISDLCQRGRIFDSFNLAGACHFACNYSFAAFSCLLTASENLSKFKDINAIYYVY